LTPWWALAFVPVLLFNAIEVLGNFAYRPSSSRTR
jgi:hypothetical protein